MQEVLQKFFLGRLAKVFQNLFFLMFFQNCIQVFHLKTFHGFFNNFLQIFLQTFSQGSLQIFLQGFCYKIFQGFIRQLSLRIPSEVTLRIKTFRRILLENLPLYVLGTFPGISSEDFLPEIIPSDPSENLSWHGLLKNILQTIL